MELRFIIYFQLKMNLYKYKDILNSFEDSFK